MKTRHGGNIRAWAKRAGKDPRDLLDFSSSINPLGPLPWLRQEIARSIEWVASYPDPDCRLLIEAACKRFNVTPEEVICGNGSSELLFCLMDCRKEKRALVPVPAYVDYARAATLRHKQVEAWPLEEKNGYALDLDALTKNLEPGTVVFLGQPNNPTGRHVDPDHIRDTARHHPRCCFVVDEAFADFLPTYKTLIQKRPKNVVVLYSLTKFFAMAGLRLGLCFAEPDLIARMEARLSPWSVNLLAQNVGARALADTAYIHHSGREVRRLREKLQSDLKALGEIVTYPAEANFLLCKIKRQGLNAQGLADKLLKEGIAIRVCDNFQGLSDRHFRIAVRPLDENQRLADALAGALSHKKIQKKPARRAATLMFQGTSSNAGKSILTTALCRILLQDGIRVAPFKAQNMSLNSFVTAEGGEMGRAQVLQAQACKLEPDVRMNPILLKPNTDLGAQIIVMGKAISHMNVDEYFNFHQEAWHQAKKAFDELSAEHDAVLLEGAGSPGEVNLKDHDLVNMKMARHARAQVLLVGDIDRGGVFASFIGHLEVMEEWERKLLAGFVINRFRGDASLLKPAFEYVERFTNKPSLGVVPYLHDMGLPDEDSVALTERKKTTHQKKPGGVNVAVVLLPHISNFTDLDALKLEPDLHLTFVRKPEQLERPDCVILPGSKNVIGDLHWLHQSGLAAHVRNLAAEKRPPQIVGICGGFQMLGRSIQDPHGLESSRAQAQGLGFLPVDTLLETEKTLRHTRGIHVASQEEIHGYEIHHGNTDPAGLVPVFKGQHGQCLGAGTQDQGIWGTYLHGIFDADRFRHWFIDDLRKRKGLEAKKSVRVAYDLEPALDRLADVVRSHLPIDKIKRMMGL
jgi:cobyric acid synthase CobQ/L-threonine-O-3-phosphate decarboxylase